MWFPEPQLDFPSNALGGVKGMDKTQAFLLKPFIGLAPDLSVSICKCPQRVLSQRKGMSYEIERNRQRVIISQIRP